MHYVGATYQYQRLMSYPTAGQNETQTHAVLFFYTLYASSQILAVFLRRPATFRYCGAANTSLRTCDCPASQAGIRRLGGSMGWQGRLTNVALSYSHMISGGGGLIGAVKMDSANASIRQQMTRRLSGSVAGRIRAERCSGFRTRRAATNGHTVSGTASLQQAVRSAYQRAAGLHPASSGLQRRCCPGRDSQHESRICFDFLSVLQTAGKINSMVDDLDEQSSEGFDLQRYLGIVRRRHLQFLIPLFLGWAVVWGASWVLPPRYRSDHADSGGAAHHAEGLRHAQRER